MSRTAAKRNHMTLLHDTSEIPEFDSEAAERAFWETHAFSEELLAKVKPEDEPVLDLPPRRKRNSKSITVRFDIDSLDRVKVLADKKNIPYQTLIKYFVNDRLYEEEKREGIISKRRKASPREAH